MLWVCAATARPRSRCSACTQVAAPHTALPLQDDVAFFWPAVLRALQGLNSASQCCTVAGCNTPSPPGLAHASIYKPSMLLRPELHCA